MEQPPKGALNQYYLTLRIYLVPHYVPFTFPSTQTHLPPFPISSFLCLLVGSLFFAVIWRTLPAQEQKLVEDLCLVELCLLKKKSASTKNLDKKAMDFYKTVVSNTHEDETKDCMHVSDLLMSSICFQSSCLSSSKSFTTSKPCCFESWSIELAKT